MKALLSFDFVNMRENIKIGTKEQNGYLCSSFINILSLDTNYIKNEIIKKTNFNNFNDIKKAYKKVNSIEPLLFIDNINFIEILNDFYDSKYIFKDYNNSIKEINDLINYQKIKDPKSELISYFSNILKDLKKKKKNYERYTTDLPKTINNIFNLLINIIDIYKEFIEFCYFNEKDETFKDFSKLSHLDKCLLYNNFIQNNKNLFNNLPDSTVNYTKQIFNTTLKEKNDIKLESTSPIYEYECDSLDQFLQISFFTCLTHDLNIKKCENCGKYFIAYQRSDEKYCSRLSPQDKNKTCKQYSNFKNWQDNLNSNEALKIYRRIYMAKQMQTRRNPEDLILKENFDTWKKEAQFHRNKYVHNEITKKEFLKWLNNNS